MGKREKQAEHLWEMFTGQRPDGHDHDADEVAERLARFGETAAAVVLRDVRAAVGFANGDFEDDDEQHRDSLIAVLEDGGDGADEYEYSELSWREPWLDEGRLGGMENVFRIRMMLEEIGGPTARRALSLLSLADGPLTTVGTKDTSALAAVLTGGDPDAAITAAYALGRIGPDAVDTLLTLFSPVAAVSDAWVDWGDTCQTVRSAAARALGRIGDRRALDALVGAIGTYDQWTSEAAIRAVISLGGDPRAVVPTLKAELLKDGGSAVWDYWDRIEAVTQMGPRTCEALIDATSDADPLARSLALRALAKIMETTPAGVLDGAAATQQRERAAARAVAERDHPSPSVRFSAIELLRRLDLPGLSDLLVPLLDDESVDEYEVDHEPNRTVGENAAEALPDDDAALESLRRSLDGGQLDAASAWKSFVDWNHSTAQVRGSVRHGEVLVPYIVEAAKRGGDPDEEVFDALRWVATDEPLERLGQGYAADAEEILRAWQIWKDREYEPGSLGRMPLRWQYRVGDEFRDKNGDHWKIVRRIPETDDWRALVFDIAVAETESVRRGERQCWWDMGVVAALKPVATGAFESLLRRWEAERVTEKKTAALKARHGADPRPVTLPADPTVQQFASAADVPAADVQKHLRERQGKLIGPRDRIGPDAFSALCDDYNVISSPVDVLP